MTVTSLDRAFQALADPTRRAIVARLMRAPHTVSDLAAPLGLSLPAIAHHLRVLESGGLVRSAKLGRVRTCRIERAAMRNVEHWMAARRADWERRLDSLGRFLGARDSEVPPKGSR
jgi:DNA-binding transcriptional ArsR family regulator